MLLLLANQIETSRNATATIHSGGYIGEANSPKYSAKITDTGLGGNVSHGGYTGKIVSTLIVFFLIF